MPSAFRSPIATETGTLPVPQSVFGPKLPSPLPSSTDTELGLRFAIARSGRPSAFKSPIATAYGLGPVSNARNGAANSGAATARAAVAATPTTSQSPGQRRHPSAELDRGAAGREPGPPTAV